MSELNDEKDEDIKDVAAYIPVEPITYEDNAHKNAEKLEANNENQNEKIVTTGNDTVEDNNDLSKLNTEEESAHGIDDENVANERYSTTVRKSCLNVGSGLCDKHFLLVRPNTKRIY